MKKHTQLGMNYGTASNRLVKDLLFDFVSKAGHVCFRCGQSMAREDFSIEHREPWLDADDPVSMFFDIANIAYSHKSCNYAAGRRPAKRYDTTREYKAAGMRRSWSRLTKEEQQQRRREKYLKYGC